MPHRIALKPHGCLLIEEIADAPAVPAFDGDAILTAGFAESSARGLLALALRRGSSGA